MNRTGWLALLFVTTTALAGCSGSSEPASPAPVSVQTSTAATSDPTLPALPASLQEAGFRPPAAGSLGADTEWVEELREQVLKHVAEHDPDRRPPAAEDITIVCAGDVGEVRYAELYYPTDRRKDGVTVWVRFWWLGEAGAAGSDMQAWTNSSTHDRPDTDPDALFLTYRNGNPGGVAVVSAPGATSVALVPGGAGEAPELRADGGAGWAGEVGKAELDEPGYLVDGVASRDNVSTSWPRRG